MVLYLLFESSSGYGLFEYLQSEEINSKDLEVQKRILDMATFKQMVKFVAFAPFRSAKDALENMNAASEGILHEYLQDFLEQNLPTTKKKKTLKLGVSEDGLAAKINETLSISCTGGSKINELLRGIRLHFDKYIKELGDGFLEQAQLGLAHAYSRGKIKYNVNRADLHIIQSICLLDQLDKDINTFAMRVREWYSWHFPELIKIVSENLMFCRLVSVLKNKSTVTADRLAEIEEVVGDEDIAQKVIDAANSSMGTDISDFDLDNVCQFANRVDKLGTFRTNLQQYLSSKMNSVAPNLTTLIGESVGARLISQAGSLTSLAKYPASTLQILGAEKALFRALKTRGKTPKYGLIFHSHFIGKAQNKNKGRISRYLANKCSIASRIDCFSETPTSVYGQKLKEQVEERLEFYNSATTPRKNIDVMKEAKELHDLEAGNDDADDVDVSMTDTTPKKKKKKKKKKANDATSEETTPKKKKKKKKKKANDDTSEETTPKKKKKKKRKRDDGDSEQPKKRVKA